MKAIGEIPEVLLGAAKPERLLRGRWWPLGIRLRWRAADRRLARAAASVLATAAACSPAGIAADLLILHARDAAAPAGLGAFRAAADGHAYREAEGLSAVLTASGSLSLADLERGKVVAWIAAGADLDAEAEALLAAPVWRLAAYRGLVACHAAALRGPDGRALLLRGLSGAGKSSLALAAWRRGWPLIAEEVTWLDGRTVTVEDRNDGAAPEATVATGSPGGAAEDASDLGSAPPLRQEPGSWRVRGRPDCLHLDAAACASAWFPTLIPSGWRPPGPSADLLAEGRLEGATPQRKLRVDLGRWPRGLCGSAPLGALVFLCRQETDLKDRWRRCGPAEARERWQATSIPGEASQAPRLLERAAEAATREGAYLLGDGLPLELADRLAEIAADAELRS